MKYARHEGRCALASDFPLVAIDLKCIEHRTAKLRTVTGAEFCLTCHAEQDSETTPTAQSVQRVMLESRKLYSLLKGLSIARRHHKAAEQKIEQLIQQTKRLIAGESAQQKRRQS